MSEDNRIVVGTPDELGNLFAVYGDTFTDLFTPEGYLKNFHHDLVRLPLSLHSQTGTPVHMDPSLAMQTYMGKEPFRHIVMKTISLFFCPMGNASLLFIYDPFSRVWYQFVGMRLPNDLTKLFMD